MPDRPVITIVCTTFFPPGPDGELRRATVERAIDSWALNLAYKGEIRLHIADDGSATEYAFGDAFGDGHVSFGDTPVTFSRQERHGVGASLNVGCRQAFARGDIVLYAVDDWELTEYFDLTPWVDLLLRDQTLCMVRLGPPHPWLTGTIEHLDVLGWGMRLDKRVNYAFGHRPALYHPRMFEVYGEFTEDVSAYTCEQLYNEHFNETHGPGIMLALPSPWVPLESIELADIDPRRTP
jgi:hypothetical protein